MHAITGITGQVGSATGQAQLEARTKAAPKFHHGDIKMHKLTLALATLAVIAGTGVTRADSSGHMSINGLAEELPRSYDALAPLADGLSPPECAWDRSGAMPQCPPYYWRRWWEIF
jgi:hypothetical protein